MLPQAILPFTGCNARFDESPRNSCNINDTDGRLEEIMLDRDNPRVRVALSIIGLVFVLASLVVTFSTGSMAWGYGLLLIGLAVTLLLRWKR